MFEHTVILVRYPQFYKVFIRLRKYISHIDRNALSCMSTPLLHRLWLQERHLTNHIYSLLRGVF